MTIHELLARDHARLDACLTAAVADPERIDDAPYHEFRTGLLRHIAIEEKVLFAYLRGRSEPETESLIRVLHADHAAIASLLVPPPTHALIATLRRVLGEHNPLEDAPGGLYDSCDRLAGAGVQELLDRMQAIAPARASQYLDEPRIHAHIERMLAARDEARRR
ncbi:MAG: hemerythrin domain-containing protein [Myxococcales bacterium]|nr:hemerythrin domain-containing protein [Myxococcales bacterium]